MKKNYKELENEKSRGKKRYLERLIEEEEANKELKEQLELFDLEEYEDRTDVRRPS